MIELQKQTVRQDYLEEELLGYLQRSKVLSFEEITEIKLQMDLGEKLENVLLRYLTTEKLFEYKSSLLGINKINLSVLSIDIAIAILIPEELARKYTAIPFALHEGRLFVAMADPNNRIAIDDIRIYTGFQVEALLADLEEIKIAIRECYTVGKSVAASVDSSEQHSIWKVEEESEMGQEAPVVRLVDSLFRQAVLERASDIHWEPIEEAFQVKFRIDGLLVIKGVLPSGIARSIAARLKVMAGMDVTKRRMPQDGRIMLDFPGKKIDIRVSTFPTVYGEKVVTRILDAETARLSLGELGMREEVEEGVRKLLRQPHGLILISGPTGSGKTTTLYALLREIQSETLNIVSIEDPVEYRLPGVNQAQVNTEVGLNFADGLRAILRQDPDIIMVGEIRDKETARIATAAALTGHLVLSTVHTNTAAEALLRLLEMEIEPYLVASAVCGVVAQRLVRRLCPFCRENRLAFAEEIQVFNLDAKTNVYKPKGCSKCRNTGYSGRIGVHEFLPYNQKMKQLILQKSSAAVLENTSREMGMRTMTEDALMKAEKGITSLEEVIRLSAGI